jgi:ornithine cyclodeaminase
MGPMDAVPGTLADFCGGVAEGRANAGDLTIFKAVGTALSDITSAALVYANTNGGRAS